MSHIRHSAFHAAVLDVFWYFLSDLMCVVEAASLISCALLHVCCRYVEEVTSWISCALLHVCCCCLSHDVLREFFCDSIIFVRVLSFFFFAWREKKDVLSQHAAISSNGAASQVFDEHDSCASKNATLRCTYKSGYPECADRKTRYNISSLDQKYCHTPKIARISRFLSLTDFMSP